MVTTDLLKEYCYMFDDFIRRDKGRKKEQGMSFVFGCDGPVKEIKDNLFRLTLEKQNAYVSTIVSMLYSHYKGGFYFDIFNVRPDVHEDFKQYQNFIKKYIYNGVLPQTIFEAKLVAHYNSYISLVTQFYSLCHHLNIDLVNVQIGNGQILLHPNQIDKITLDYLGYPVTKQKEDFKRLIEGDNVPEGIIYNSNLMYDKEQLIKICNRLGSLNSYVCMSDADRLPMKLMNANDNSRDIIWQGKVSQLVWFIVQIYNPQCALYSQAKKIFDGKDFNKKSIKAGSLPKKFNPPDDLANVFKNL